MSAGTSVEVNSSPSQYIDLSPGDFLVLATDGLYEWENDQGEQFGSEPLAQIIRKFRQNTPQQMIESLYSAVFEFSGRTRQQDDLTAVVTKKTAVSQPVDGLTQPTLLEVAQNAQVEIQNKSHESLEAG